MQFVSQLLASPNVIPAFYLCVKSYKVLKRKISVCSCKVTETFRAIMKAIFLFQSVKRNYRGVIEPHSKVL